MNNGECSTQKKSLILQNQLIDLSTDTKKCRKCNASKDKRTKQEHKILYCSHFLKNYIQFSLPTSKKFH